MVTMDAVNGYLKPLGVTMEDKVKHLYRERFLIYVRSAVRDNKCYILASCAAEMKKHVSYCIDIVIDNEGVIVECQCECAVGTGPNAHCKHIQCLFFGLVSFNQSHNLLTKQTCTQKLQTFHKCQAYKGSPIKASDLSLRTEGGSRELKRLLDFDPRPEKFRKMDSYQSYFNNLTINYQANYGCKDDKNPMPILQTIAPANIYAVCQDHHYFTDTPEELFLQSECLSKISDQEIIQLEVNTRGQSHNKKWLSERCKRITASNFGRVCKCTDRTDKTALANSLMSVQSTVNAKSLQHGHTFETIAVNKFENLNSVHCQPCGIFVSKSLPFLSCTPDAIIDENTLLEVKCPYVSREKVINEVTVPFLKSIDGQLTLDRKHNYFYQVQGQLFCSNRNVCKFVVYTFKDLVTVNIERDDEFISTMVSQLTDFYNGYFRENYLNKYLYRNTFNYNFND